MTDNTQMPPSPDTATPAKTQERGPSMVAYTVKDRGDQAPVWRAIGAAFTHKDKKGLDLVLDAMPVDGRVTLRAQRKEAFKEKRRETQSRGQERPRDQEFDR